MLWETGQAYGVLGQTILRGNHKNSGEFPPLFFFVWKKGKVLFFCLNLRYNKEY